MHDSDERVARAIAGNPDALEALLRAHEPTVRARLQIAPKWVRSIDVDDVLQVAWLEAYLRIQGLRSASEASFVAWLSRIAENNLIDAVRSLESGRRPDANCRVTHIASGESARTLLQQVAGDDATAGSHASLTEEVTRLRAAIARMPVSYRQVVELMDLEQLTVDEVAAKMSRSPGAVHMLRARAHDRLAELLRERA
ncbi:MAG: sigma-70 family RNA polymerase sigma factor [Planctomycetota bacterium]